MLAASSDLGAVVALFGSAVAAAWLLRLLAAPAIIGFLCAGIAIGPFGVNLIDQDRVHFFAELGLALLLFTVGLELSPDPLIRLGRRLPLAAFAQILATSAAAILILRLGFDTSWTAACLAGLAVSLSSTAIVLKQLSERHELDTPVGTLITGILLIQDMVVILALLLLPLLAPRGDGHTWQALLNSGLALLALVGVTLLAHLVMPTLIQQVFRRGGQELMTLFAVLMACGGAWLADLAGWSWALGSCMAGLLLAQTDLRHQLHAEITPFRDTFNALFFISIGMLVDVQLALRYALPLLAIVVATLTFKTLLTGLAVSLAGWPIRIATAAGLGLCTISEFGYVLMSEATRLDLMSAELVRQLIAVTVGTMLLGAILVPVSGRISFAVARLLSRSAPAADGAGRPDSLAGHVILVGYGLNGRNVASVLRAVRIPFVVVEMNRAWAAQARAENEHVIVGDATRASILHLAGLDHARALVVAISDPAATRSIVAQAHARRPSLYILARTRAIHELDALYQLGARLVIPEEFETSIEIFAHLLREFGLPDNIIDQQVTLVRAGRYGMLRGRPTDRALRAEWLHALEAAATRTYLVQAASPACHKSLRELDLRARTGITVVAVTRGGKPIANPSPDLKIEPDDVLVLVGTHKQLSEVDSVLDPPDIPGVATAAIDPV